MQVVGAQNAFFNYIFEINFQKFINKGIIKCYVERLVHEYGKTWNENDKICFYLQNNLWDRPLNT